MLSPNFHTRPAMTLRHVKNSDDVFAGWAMAPVIADAATVAGEAM